MQISNKKILKENIQKNIRFYRKKAKLTQGDLAKLMGVTPAAISSWECGNNQPDVDTLFCMCNALKVNFYDMCGITSENILMSDDKNALLKIYDSLNEDGKIKLVERAKELLELGYEKRSDQKMA